MPKVNGTFVAGDVRATENPGEKCFGLKSNLHSVRNFRINFKYEDVFKPVEWAPGLSSLHTIFVREHNRIARALSALDASLSDEELYQRSRRY